MIDGVVASDWTFEESFINDDVMHNNNVTIYRLTHHCLFSTVCLLL